MNDDSDFSSNLRDMAPSQRKFRFGDSSVALMKVVFWSCRVSLIPMMASPSKKTSRNLVRWPESLVSNVKVFAFSITPFTTSDDPSIKAYSSPLFFLLFCLWNGLESKSLNFFSMLLTFSLKFTSILEQFLLVCEILHLSPFSQLIGAVKSSDISISSFLSLQSSIAQLMSFSQHTSLKLSLSVTYQSESQSSSSSESSPFFSSFFFSSPLLSGISVRHCTFPQLQTLVS